MPIDNTDLVFCKIKVNSDTFFFYYATTQYMLITKIDNQKLQNTSRIYMNGNAANRYLFMHGQLAKHHRLQERGYK